MPARLRGLGESKPDWKPGGEGGIYAGSASGTGKPGRAGTVASLAQRILNAKNAKQPRGSSLDGACIQVAAVHC